MQTSRRSLLFGLAGLVSGCAETPAALPSVALPALAGLMSPDGGATPGLDTRGMAGKVTLLNVWASWCPYCRGEHDLLLRLSRGSGIRIAGLVHNDTADKARAYLQQAGNPYVAVSVDEGGIVSRALRIRGVPYTYVIGADLAVLAKVPGALSESAINTIIRPALAKARTPAI